MAQSENTSSLSSNQSQNHVQIIQPQNQLVTTKLTENNFLIWRQQILTTVRGYGLEDYLTGEVAVLEKFIVDSDTNQRILNPEYTTYHRQDSLLASWLLSSLSESVLVLMVGLNSVCEMWQTLEVSFASQSKARLMQYKLQLQTLKKGNMSMREYLNKVKVCCDTLASAGQRVSDEDQILHVLSGLGSEYDSVMVSITSRTEPYSMKDVSALLLSFESRLESFSVVSDDNVVPTANVAVHQQTRKQNNANTSQFGRGRGGSFTRGGRGFHRGAYRGRGGRYSNNSGRPQCQVCYIFGHTADRCYYRFDSNFSPQSPSSSNARNQAGNRQFNSGQGGQMTAMVATQDNISEASWFPDSGASNHVTYDLANLNLASDYQGHNKLHLGNGSGPNHGGGSTQGDT